ncbi:MAG: site-specific DNA-methyltransferase, partial [Syntrophales bacterium]
MAKNLTNNGKTVETLTHEEARRKNIPTAEFQSVMNKDEQSPVRVAYERGAVGLEEEKAARNRDLDPQLVWRGKDEQDWSDLVMHAPPLYIQEKVHPKVLIDDLLRQSAKTKAENPGFQTDLFADFNGLPSENAKTEFYQHDANWANRLILGDSLQVMASLAEREGLRGKVQCIYLDPPYGIKFNSNFQWSTTSRDVKDGNVDHITREPEQVKAFRDTWRDGIHSYLTYLRDRLTVARDLLTDSGSIFVQIGDENVHLLRSVLDEVFSPDSFVSLIAVRKTGAVSSPDARLNSLATIADYIIWYSKCKDTLKYRQLYAHKNDTGTSDQYRLVDDEGNYQSVSIESNGYSETFHYPVDLYGKRYSPAATRHWSTTETGIHRAARAQRVLATERKIRFKKYLEDFPVSPIANIWADVMGSSGLIYVVQTNEKIIERCLLMATDPGDLVLDPTCGSGTTAYVAEQWGRRWIT